MRIHITLFLLIIPAWIFSQPDSLPRRQRPLSRSEKIADTRWDLQYNFEQNDVSGVAFWLDSLTHLSNEEYTAIAWDERWLLYLWMGAYGNLLEEVAEMNRNTLALEAEKIQAPEDSLFEIIDRTLYDNRFELFQRVKDGFLTEEERLATFLLIEYLLRLQVDKKDAYNSAVEAFIKRYPGSRYNPFLRTTLYFVYKPDLQQGFSLDLSFTYGAWRGALERHLAPFYGLEFGMAYWRKRVNYGLRFGIGGTKLRRDIEQNGFFWLKDESATVWYLDLDAGYDIINNQKLRVYPAITGGISRCAAEQPSEDNDVPDYYQNFRFFSASWGAALHFDVKFKLTKPEPGETGSYSYNAVRLKVGWRRSYWGRDNNKLAGDMLYLSVGFSPFWYGSTTNYGTIFEP